MRGRSASGAGRVPCLVPFCRCTIPQERHPGATEIICAKHWRPVSAETKARYRQVKRRRDKLWKRMCDPRVLRRPTVTPAIYEKARDAVHSTWEKCKAEAIERAAGI